MRRLGALANRRSLGFICGEKASVEDRVGEFLLDNVIFSDGWSEIWKLCREGRRQGFQLGPATVGIFDLDQTVYAARGRNDEALREARFAAVRLILQEALGPHRYSDERVRRLYRVYDSDEFHPITGDNQDYVVFFTLVSSLGLHDPDDVRREFGREDSSLVSFIANVRAQVDLRGRQEPMGQVWELVQEIYYNSLSGEPTPLKAFRQREFLSTAEAMGGNGGADAGAREGRIVLTKEVVELVEYLKGSGCHVVAFSDRPPEAAYAMDEGAAVSILDIPMLVVGETVRERLGG